MTIHNITLKSTALSGATYDTENKTLSITFTNGGTYDHHDVPEEIFRGLESAGSAGRYWHQNIKDIYR